MSFRGTQREVGVKIYNYGPTRSEISDDHGWLRGTYRPTDRFDEGNRSFSGQKGMDLFSTWKQTACVELFSQVQLKEVFD